MGINGKHGGVVARIAQLMRLSEMQNPDLLAQARARKTY